MKQEATTTSLPQKPSQKCLMSNCPFSYHYYAKCLGHSLQTYGFTVSYQRTYLHNTATKHIQTSINIDNTTDDVNRFT